MPVCEGEGVLATGEITPTSDANDMEKVSRPGSRSKGHEDKN